jgi:hypothetical protein
VRIEGNGRFVTVPFPQRVIDLPAARYNLGRKAMGGK